MRLLAVVVLYYPGKDLAGNIESYLPETDKLLLWDNTPGGGRERLSLSDVSHPERLEYRGCGRNAGIGAALNDAVAYAREHGYTHLLTLDQDSYFLKGDFRRYLAAIRDYGEDRQVIFSVNYFIKSWQAPLYPVVDTVDEVSSAMTSGTVYPVAVRGVGRFHGGAVRMGYRLRILLACGAEGGGYRLFQGYSVAARFGVSEAETPPAG